MDVAPRPPPRRPLLAYLNGQLSLGARLAALSAVFCIPIVLLTGLFIAQSWKDISFARREVDGAVYEKAIWPVLRVSAFGRSAAANLGDLEVVRAEYDARFGAGAASQALVAATNPSARIAAGKALMVTVADRSNLTLDPDLDSFYVMDAVTQRLPSLLLALDRLGQAAGLPAGDSTRPLRIADALQDAADASGAASDDLATAMKANASGKTRAALAGHAAALARLTAQLGGHRDALLAGAPLASALPDVRALQDELLDTWRVARDELQRLLEARIMRLGQTLALNLFVVVYFVGLAAALALVMVGGVRARMAALLAAMDRLIAGDTRLAVPFLGDRNETGRIANTVEAFRLSQIEGERLRQAAADQALAADEARAVAEAERERVVRFLSVGELASSIAHEINQPIAAVVAGGAAALRWLQRDPPNLERARSAITRIDRDANRASAVIQRIRQVLGKSAPALVQVDINAVAEEAMLFTDRERALAGVETRLDLAADLPAVRGDAVQLQQVIINLVLNALDAMKADSGRPRVLTLATAPAGDAEVMVSVADTGVGLSSDAAERLFDPFFTTKQTGMGLGLSISRSILDQHAGRLWAEPAEVGGAVFRFTLPKWPSR